MSSAAEQVLVHCAELVSMRPSTMASNIANEECIRTEPRREFYTSFQLRPDYFICEAQQQGFSNKTGDARARGDFRLGGAKRKVPRDRREERWGVKDLPRKPWSLRLQRAANKADTDFLCQHPKITCRIQAGSFSYHAIVTA
jgi:hypothetical protein